jgi:hypothetical protein
MPAEANIVVIESPQHQKLIGAELQKGNHHIVDQASTKEDALNLISKLEELVKKFGDIVVVAGSPENQDPDGRVGQMIVDAINKAHPEIPIVAFTGLDQYPGAYAVFNKFGAGLTLSEVVDRLPPRLPAQNSQVGQTD